jgi:hypothetical protein
MDRDLMTGTVKKRFAQDKNLDLGFDLIFVISDFPGAPSTVSARPP